MSTFNTFVFLFSDTVFLVVVSQYVSVFISDFNHFVSIFVNVISFLVMLVLVVWYL